VTACLLAFFFPLLQSYKEEKRKETKQNKNKTLQVTKLNVSRKAA
jgi:hypothetical protein